MYAWKAARERTDEGAIIASPAAPAVAPVARRRSRRGSRGLTGGRRTLPMVNGYETELRRAGGKMRKAVAVCTDGGITIIGGWTDFDGNKARYGPRVEIGE
jgi:hypothetical protein